MSGILLLSIHYDGEIVYDEENFIGFRSTQLMIAYMTTEINSLIALKNLILHSIRQQHTKRVKKIYYRYPAKLDNILFYKKYIVDVVILLFFHESSAIRDPMTDPYQVNFDNSKDVEAELTKIPYEGEEEEEMNFYNDTQIALTQPAISCQYDWPDHFSTLNLDAITLDCFFSHRESKEDPIRLWMEHTHILLAQVGMKVRRYNAPHSCMQTSVDQDHRRLDSKVIAQHIFTMVKADPTISIRAIQGGMKNYFGYKTSYRKV
ncbi:hypothetical protein Ahy_A08g037978 [Arachis hypogaea]|uniref:Uncharacterized protein n=1 Tax=Arachis hypogaea TaxID=3818 RepID=A0A445BSI5_ARAHY|nr:hypothetical protein Ahy_A08g037978 [Arachis hypogaea]